MQDVVPKGALNIVHGRGAGVGDTLINSPEMEAISKTLSGDDIKALAAYIGQMK